MAISGAVRAEGNNTGAPALASRIEKLEDLELPYGEGSIIASGSSGALRQKRKVVWHRCQLGIIVNFGPKTADLQTSASITQNLVTSPEL